MSTQPAVLTSDPGPDPVTGIDPYPTLASAISNSIVAAKNNCALLNAYLETIYLNKFKSWAQSVSNGFSPNTDPPQPPMAFEPTVDSASGFTFPELGKTPVCAMPPVPNMPPVPPVLVPNTISVGAHIVSDATGKWFSVGPTDTFGPGLTTPPVTSADGVTGTFEKFGSPFGGGWYFLTNRL
jgi:hypothetical protein